DVDLLVVLQGLQSEPVVEAIVSCLGDRALRWPLASNAPMGEAALHAAADPAHEAEMAAACVMRRLAQGHAPVALPAIDRVLTRRIRAMLAAQGVALRDETGWKLSTTRAAAQLVCAIKACAWDAASDDVIDWLKNAPAVPSGVCSALERRVRRAGLRSWSSITAERIGGEPGGWSELIARANEWREPLRAARALPKWQQAVRELLQACGMWEALVADPAGEQVAEVLGLDPDAQARWSELPQAARRMTLADFTHWAGEALEDQSFVPDAAQDAQVVILPFNQLLGRPFAALVVAGCDEARLAPSPEPAGDWTAAQRLALGLPSREQLEQTLRAGWRSALEIAQVDLLHRSSDDTGEPVLPSPLVQQLLLEGAAQRKDDPRELRELPLAPTARPHATAPGLAVAALSASAYDDLRKCPYRFFAMRQLGLQEASEIDADLDKRDFGNWLHETLRGFHEALREAPTPEADIRRSLMNDAAEAATRKLGLPQGEFLPFEAAWPQAREGYLKALAKFESEERAVFESAETDHESPLGALRLIGRIDRIDHLPDGRRMVMDYKTESATVTSARVKQPFEDTQLAFYAALLEDDSLRAAYVNVGERGETKFIEQHDVVDARDALVEGIRDDLARIAQGAPLPALGEGQACDFCAARGLCRKDFWTA
ncbi:MAG TPA: PD-(D/E)XK nuclease family protein, partial [Ramlibacter sp.]|nr:PD-(D/E)XK nuclease family protein [Ramlibacter sp.]